MDPTAANPARRPGSGRRTMAARNQIRRLPDACAPRSWRYALADAHRPRLDAQISGDRRGRNIARLSARLISTASPAACVPMASTSFRMIQLASGSGNAAALVFFLFDLLYVDGEDWTARPLVDRKTRLAASMRVCAKISLRPRCAARCRVRSDRWVRRRDAIMCGFNCIGLRLLAVRCPHRSQ